MPRLPDLRRFAPGATLRVCAAVPICLAAWVVRLMLVGPESRGIPFLTFYPAVMFCSLLAGLAGGVLATLTSALMVFFWIQQGRASFQEGLAMAVFVASSLTVAALLESGRRARIGRREADAALAERANFQIIFEHASLGIAWHDRDGLTLQANPAFLAMLGFTRAELPELRIRDYLHPDEGPEVFALRQALVRGELAELRRETRWIRKSGETLWVSIHVRPVRDPDGEIRSTFIMAEDITARKATELELRRVLREQEIILETADVGISLVVDRRQVWVNPWVPKVLGYSLDEVRNTTTRMLYPTQEAYELLGQKAYPALARGETYETVQELLTKDGRPLSIKYHGKAINPEDMRQGTLWILMDVTSQKRAETALALEREQLEQLNRSLEARVQEGVAALREKDQLLITQNRQAAMGEMIGNIAHQWRQPLNALSILLANLRDDYRFGTLEQEGMERSFTDGDRIIQRMSSTINDFKDFFRPDKAMAAFSARRQVEAAVALVADALAASGIRVEIHAAGDPQLFGYPNEYSQVLLNLLGNARDAILGQGVQPGRIVLRLGTRDGFGELSVADNGKGIPPEALDRIFEPYFSTRAAGTGIGLYMSRQIIERSMGGRIRVRNGADGAEFTILVPTSGGLP